MESLPWTRIKTEVERCMTSLQAKEACDLLLKVQCDNLNDEGERQLLLVKVYTLRGLFSLAHESLDQFGCLQGRAEKFLLEQLNLLYLSGGLSQWHAVIMKALPRFMEKNKIRFGSMTTNEKIGFLKHFEEAGFVAEVIEAYEFLEKQTTDNRDSLKIETQLMRLYSTWKMRIPLAAIYQRMLILSPQEIHEDIYVEVQHGLLLSETILFGSNVGLDRLKRNLSLNLDLLDRRLMIFDYLELTIRLENKIPVMDLDVESLGTLDAYEIQIYRLISNPKKEITFNFTEMSSGAFFRLIAVANALGLSISNMLLPQCLFLLEQFSVKTKKLWISRLNLQSSADNKFFVSYQDKKVSYGDRQLSLQSYPTLVVIINSLLQNEEKLSLEVLMQKLFGRADDLAVQDRLRVHINRLNRLFEKELGIMKPFKICEGFLMSELIFKKDAA